MRSPRFDIRAAKLRIIFSPANIERIWKDKVRASMRDQFINDGIENFDFHVACKLESKKLSHLILSGDYTTQRAQRILVEKSKGLCRQLVIPTIRDAIVLQCLSDALYDEIKGNPPYHLLDSTVMAGYAFANPPELPQGLLMAPTKINPDNIRAFKDAESFHTWLGKHHDKEAEIWIKIHKVDSGLKSITPKEAIDVVLCWGWIDGLRKGFDDKSFLQRYTRRTTKSVWSQINVDNVARLTSEGRMTEHGLREVDRAKSDGRWARAYNSKDMKIPDDLQAAIDAEPKARAMLAKLSAQNRFALAFRTHNMKTEAGRAKKIAAFVAMLKRGETIYPQGKK